MKKNVIIVGGGFAGVKTALELSKANLYNIKLISSSTSLTYYPTLYRVATGGEKESAKLNYTDIFKNLAVDIINDTIEKLDETAKKITSINGTSYNYDILVLALGALTNYFGIPGLEEKAYSLKSIADAERLKAHLHETVLSKDVSDHNFIVVGGGPTGIEIASELNDYLSYLAKLHNITNLKTHVSIVEASDRLVRTLPKDASKAITKRLQKLNVKIQLNQAVKSLDDHGLLVNDKTITTKTVIWTAGTRNHPFFTANNFNTSPNHKIDVDMYLQAKKDVYVLGDNANTPYSGLAETAVYDGKFVAQNLIAQAKNQPLKLYHPKTPITILPVGKNWAALVHRNIRAYGLIGFGLRRFADAYAFHDYEPWDKVGKKWLDFYKKEDICKICS